MRALRSPTALFAGTALVIGACRHTPQPLQAVAPAPVQVEAKRPYVLERVDDVQVVQLYADGFPSLSLRDKLLAWNLYQAALAGRDIFLQQKCAQALDLRALLEEILTHPEGISEETLREVQRYTKLFWINNGPYNALTARKNTLRGSRFELRSAAEQAHANGARFPLRAGEEVRDFVQRLEKMLFDEDHEPLLTTKSPAGNRDVIQASAVTFYEDGISVRNLAGYPERYELNSNIAIKPSGQYEEQVWRAGLAEQGIPPGMYAAEIEAVIAHLEAALELAPDPTRRALQALVRFYRSGEEQDRVAYDVAWVADADSKVDTINGFVEVYLDPRGKKGSWEGIVFYEDPRKAELIERIASQAQWFEDHMPYDDAFKKPDVKGISARSIDVVIGTGDAGPVSAVGINLPNDSSIREQHGSKSVSLANVVEAYAQSGGSKVAQEFCWDQAEVQREEEWLRLTQDLFTNMHEVIGHASGRQAEGRQGNPADWLKECYSTLEEARADLVALYFMMDEKLEQLGLVSDAAEAALAHYEHYTRNGGMLQLRRVKDGEVLEDDHMRNRQLIVRWIMAHSGAIEERERDGAHYLVVTDARAWREAAGRLLAQVQALKSTGDYAGARQLVAEYGTRFDPALRDEVVLRCERLDTPAYTAFVMPRLTPVTDSSGAVVDVAISYPLSLEQQMLEWSGRRAAPGR